MLLQVVGSWQVIAVTVALVLYMSLVSYTARSYHRPRSVSKSKPKKKKSKAAPPAAKPEESAGGKEDDELGMEEA